MEKIVDRCDGKLKNLHIPIDKGMKEKDSEALAGVNHYTMNGMNRGENVAGDIPGKICTAPNCKVEDTVDFPPDKDDAETQR